MRRPLLRLAHALAVTAFFTALTVIHTWPLASVLDTRLLSSSEVPAAVWSVNDLAYQLIHDPTHLFDGRSFYPYGGSLAALDHHLTTSVVVAPLVWAQVDPITVFNLAFLVSFVLSGVCGYLLVYRLTGSVGAGLVSGTAYAFSHFRFLHVQQLHVLVMQFVPLALLALHAFLERPSWRRWGLLAGAGALVALSSWHAAVVGGFTVGIAALWLLAARPGGEGSRTGVGRRVGMLVLAGGVVLALILPIARVYQATAQAWGSGRGESVGTHAALSAHVSELVRMPSSATTPYASWLTERERRMPLFPGIVLLGLAVPAVGMLWRGTRATRPRGLRLVWLGALPATVAVLAAMAGGSAVVVIEWIRPFAPFVLLAGTLVVVGLTGARRLDAASGPAVALTYAAVAIAGLFMAFGPVVVFGDLDLGHGVYWPRTLPPLSLLRAPVRFLAATTLGLAVLAGLGVQGLVRGRSRPVAVGIVAGVLLVLNVDLRHEPSPFEMTPPEDPSAVAAWLKEAPEPGAVIEYPDTMWAVYNNWSHGRPVANGRGWMWPPAMDEVAQPEPLAASDLRTLWEQIHPRFVVVKLGLYAGDRRMVVERNIAARPDALRERARFGDTVIYELIDRGMGQQLRRVWPRAALEGARGVAVAGRLTGGRADTRTRLVVTLNEQPLLELSGPEARDFSELVPFERGQLVEGVNVLEIRADYLSRRGHPVGATGVALPADVTAVAGRDTSFVQVNGQVVRGGKGYLLAAIDPARGVLDRVGRFNTSWYAEDSARLVDFVDALPEGTPVVVAAQYDVSRELTGAAVEALESLGLDTDLRGALGMLHAGIGVKGAPVGTALESVDPRESRVWVGERDDRQVQLTTLTLY